MKTMQKIKIGVLGAVVVVATVVSAQEGSLSQEMAPVIKEAEAEGLDGIRLRRMISEGEAKQIPADKIKNAIKEDVNLMRAAKKAFSVELQQKENLGPAADLLKAGYSNTEIETLANKWCEKAQSTPKTFRYALMTAATLRIRGGKAKDINRAIGVLAERGAGENDFLGIVSLVRRAEKVRGVSCEEAMRGVSEILEKGASINEAAQKLGEESGKSENDMGNGAMQGDKGSMQMGKPPATEAGTTPGRAKPEDTKRLLKKGSPGAESTTNSSPSGKSADTQGGGQGSSR